MNPGQDLNYHAETHFLLSFFMCTQFLKNNETVMNIYLEKYHRYRLLSTEDILLHNSAPLKICLPTI